MSRKEPTFLPDPTRGGTGTRWRDRLATAWTSPALVAFLLAAFLPLWGVTRLSSWSGLLRSGALMAGNDIILGTAAAPKWLFPWFYDETERTAFLAKKDPFAVWDPGNPAQAMYVHIPPWEPGIALPLKLARRLFGVPLSLVTLTGLQLGLDAVVLGLVGLLGFRIGGAVSAFAGMWIYAGWGEPAVAAAFPFYYYWPNVFTVPLVGLAAFLIRRRDRQPFWPGYLAAGLLVGLWCWFRGTAISLILAAPVAVAIAVAPRGRAARAGALCLLGALLALAPSACHNLPRSGTITPRSQIWHDMFIGIGTRPNPYGIEHRDEYAFDLAKRKYGAPFPSAAYEKALRKEYLAVLTRDPGLILRNFFLNLWASLRGWTFVQDPLRLHGWLWLTTLLGIGALTLFRSARNEESARLLLFASLLWLAQCATLSLVKNPQQGYLWETLSVSVVAGAGGLGAIVEAGRRRLLAWRPWERRRSVGPRGV